MISAVVNTYNEERNIKKCLDSLAWADEIIVVDMDSKDATREIARRMGARVYRHDFTGYVEPARNFAIEKSRNEWVLLLDADESFPQNLVSRIKEIALQKKIHYVRFPRKNIIFSKWISAGGWWPDYKIRFFKKGSVVWTEKIHGVPVTYGQGLDIEASEENSIIHHNYDSIEQYITRLNRYTGVQAKHLAQDNLNIRQSDIITQGMREFVVRFLVWQGFRDGIHGLALAILQGFSQSCVYMKLWQIHGFKKSTVSLERLGRQISREGTVFVYWYYDKLLLNAKSAAGRIFLKAVSRFKRICLLLPF